MRTFIGLMAVVGMGICLCAPAEVLAADTGTGAKKDVAMVKKMVQGEVGAVGGGGLALVVERNKTRTAEKEIWFPVDSKVKLSGVKKLNQLQPGDIAEVAYVEAADGSKRMAKEVRFVSPKPPELVVIEPEVDEAPVLRSEGELR